MSDDNQLNIAITATTNGVAPAAAQAKDAVNSVSQAVKSQTSVLQADATQMSALTQALGQSAAASTALTTTIASLNGSLGSVNSSGATGARALTTVAHAADGAAHSSTGFYRELIVLGHEMLNGNYTRFGGSMLVLGERTGNLGKIVGTVAEVLSNPFTLALTVAGAALAGIALHTEEAAHAMNHLHDEMAVSGRATEFDPKQIDAYTQSLTRAGVSGKQAAEILQTLYGRADLTNDSVRNLVAVIGKYSQTTGVDAVKATELFLQAGEGSQEALKKLNQQLGTFSIGVRNSVKDATDLGTVNDGLAIVTKKVQDATDKTNVSYTAFGKTIKYVTDSLKAMSDTLAYASGQHFGAPAAVGPADDSSKQLSSAMDSGKYGTDAQLKEAKDFQDKALQVQLEALTAQMDAFKEGSQQRIAILNQELALIKSFEGDKSKLYLETEGKLNEAERTGAAESDRLATQQANKAQESQSRILQSNETTQKQLFEIKKKTIDDEAALGDISQQQQIQSLTDLCNQEYALELKALQDKVALWQEGTAQYVEANNQIKVLAAQHQEDLNNIRVQGMKAEAKDLKSSASDWKSYANTIGSTLKSAFSSMLQGTMNWKQEMSNLLGNLVGTVFDKQIDAMVTKWFAGETAKTGATVAGDAARTASTTAAATAGSAAQNTANSATITKDAATAAAGAYSAIAAIPYVGPVLAPVAAGVAFTAVMAYDSLASFDVGSWNLPGDMVAQVHQGEMIIPRTFADDLRSNGGLGGGGDTHMHFHGTLIDSKFWNQHGASIVDSIHQQHRNGNPKTRGL